MNRELLETLEYIEKEKNVSKEVLLEALRSALISACRKTFPKMADIDVQINPMTADIQLLENGQEVFSADFGRIAAQTAKQVIIQKIREAERESIFSDFAKKEGEIVAGTVHRIDRKVILVDFGKTEGILPAREQSPNDRFRQGDSVKVYVLEVKKTDRGPEVIVSRAHAHFVKKLFELEVPEIREGIVQIKSVAREAGSRTKIAVMSGDSKVDCVGSCVGVRGQRVKNIMREVGGEKLDIVRWSDDPESYIRNSLSPAQLGEIKVNQEEKSAEIFVDESQLSLAIGKKGQNVRLASKLTAWKLDIRNAGEKVPLKSLEGVGEELEHHLRDAGILNVRDLLKAKPEDLAKIEGVDLATAQTIIASAHKALREEVKADKEQTGASGKEKKEEMVDREPQPSDKEKAEEHEGS